MAIFESWIVDKCVNDETIMVNGEWFRAGRFTGKAWAVWEGVPAGAGGEGDQQKEISGGRIPRRLKSGPDGWGFGAFVESQ